MPYNYRESLLQPSNPHELPFLQKSTDQSLAIFPQVLQELAGMALRTPKANLDPNILTPHYLPKPEAIPAIINSKFPDEKSKQEFFAQAEKNGYFFYFDGNKVKAVDEQFGSAAADAYVAHNLEMALQAWNRLGYKDVSIQYSGDEAVGIISSKSHLNVEDIYVSFNKLSYEYYKQDTSQFKEINEYLKSIYPSEGQDGEMGIHIKLCKVKKAYIRKPKENTVFRTRQLAAAIIDATEDKNLDDIMEKARLIDEIYLASENTIQIDPRRTVNTSLYPRKVKAAYDLSIETNPELKSQALALAETATFEPLFSREHNVRRAEHMTDDVSDFVNSGHIVHIGRISDITVKDANTFAHTKGDNELIATINIIKRLIGKVENIYFYQDRGNFFFITWDLPNSNNNSENWTQVRSSISDSFKINKQILLDEIEHSHQGSKNAKLVPSTDYRAQPFIVVTTKIYDSSRNITLMPKITKENLSQLPNILENLKITHRNLELLIPFAVSGLLVPGAIGAIREFNELICLSGGESKVNEVTIPLRWNTIKQWIHYLNILSTSLRQRKGRKSNLVNLLKKRSQIKDPDLEIEKIIDYLRTQIHSS